MKLFRRPSTEPLWRDEFSVHTADERYVNRRQFTKFLLLTSLGMFVGNMWIVVRSAFSRPQRYPQQPVASLGEVPVGGVKLFTYPTAQDHCILVRVAEDTYVAYSQKCTHLSCAVYFSAPRGQLLCPCHQGVFSLKDGVPLAGPPRRPLPQVEIERRGTDLFAVGLRTLEKA